jgi:hypothetical protein
MPSSGMWRRVELVWTTVSEEPIASIFKIEKNPQARNQCEQVGAATETSVHRRSTRRHISEDGTLHGYRRENFKKSYIT